MKNLAIQMDPATAAQVCGTASVSMTAGASVL